jgi:copper chaperone CopZ
VSDVVKAVKKVKGMNQYEVKTVTVTLRITGMTCDECVATVRSALQAVKGVVDAKITLEKEEAIVTYQPAEVTLEGLINAVKRAKGMNRYSAEVQEGK